MSKTLAAEIADRTLEIINPQNRGIALTAALKRHGFVPEEVDIALELSDRKALIDWLQSRYSAQRDRL